MSDSFTFKGQLEVGQNGEHLFLQHYHSPIIVVPEHDYDFKRISDGKKIELKTDTYDMNSTPNIFIERYSSFEKKSPGSVWQSAEKKVQIFVYHFVRNSTYLEFDLKELLKYLQPIADKKDSKGGWIFVKNRGFITAGFTVKREDVKHLYTEYKYEPKG